MYVLIILGETELREALTRTLKKLGHEAEEARDGTTALALLQSRARLPDVIVLDLTMPNTEGQRFRVSQLANDRLSEIPTLVMTGVEMGTTDEASAGSAPLLQPSWSAEIIVAALAAITEPPASTKICSCGRSYVAATWIKLRRVGEIDNGRNAGERIELRNCPCGSTLGWEQGRHAMSLRFRVAH